MTCARLRSIPARPLLTGELQEQVDSILLPLEMLDPLLPGSANAAPLPDETCLPEQRRINLHGIVAGHVPARILALDVDLVRLGYHAGIFRRLDRAVQRLF